MRIQYDGLAWPVSKRLADAITELLTQHEVTGDSVTINFRDPNYSAEEGGFHPVEIRLEQRGDDWHFCYITDFTYVGIGPYAELAKDLDFDFQAGIFQTLFGVFPIEQGREMYQIWEGNFLHYWQELDPYLVVLSI
ncbi:DUF2787 family protein [Planctobacterium marinum]|uniref:DUF2787 family protein n=1 Tax=Planctobacterium marinum TaxID=1631968 RepID=UPI001E46AA9A|nr:DUF2787 family protein [Planctobacterium marinum]MCC2606809.1 DUF2787 domain-containing protein [Planctobacterium marinum]